MCFARVFNIGAIFFNTEITIITSYRKAMVVEKPFFTIAVVSLIVVAEVKNKGKFQTFSYKSGRARLREVGLQEAPNIVI